MPYPDIITSQTTAPPASLSPPPESAPSVIPKPRGGKRPGAGAPKGNFNALKHGRRSRQFAEIGALIAANPQLRHMLLDLGRRHEMKQARADQVAAALFARMILRAQAISRGELFGLAPGHERPSINLDAANFADMLAGIDPKILRKAGLEPGTSPITAPARARKTRKTRKQSPLNQKSGTSAPAQSDPKRKTTLD